MTMKKNPGHLVLFPIGLIVSLVVLVNTASRSIEKSEPELAYVLNPLNVEALFVWGAEGLPNPDFEITDKFQEAVESSVSLSPGDARLLSLRGGLLDRQGDTVGATENYERALEMLPTELFALSSLFVRDLQNNNVVSAVQRSEIFMRRWNQRWQYIRPYLPLLATSEEGREAITEVYADFPKGRKFIVSALLAQRETIGFANALLQDWTKRGFEGTQEEFDRLLWALVQLGEDRVAYKLHIDNILATGDQEVSFVSNGEFSQPLVNNPFGWRVSRQAGVQIERRKSSSSLAGNSDFGENYLSIKFLGNPLNFRNLSQFARLPAGPYSISLTYATDSLETPTPVELRVRCKKSPVELLQLELAASERKTETGTGEFAVPENDCDLAEIYFATDKLPLSWRNRFSGEIQLFKIEITRKQN